MCTFLCANSFYMIENQMCMCDRKTLRFPHNFSLLIFISIYNLLPMSKCESCDLLLTTRIWQRWWAITPLTVLHYKRLHIANIWLCSLSHPFSITDCEEASYHEYPKCKEILLIIWVNLEIDPSPIQSPEDNLLLVNTLILAVQRT